MARLTYSIVGRTLFSFNTTDDAATIERAMRVMLPLLFKRLGQVAPPPLWFPTRANRDFNRALSEVDQVVYRIIASHRQAAKMDATPNDLLGLLMQARDPERGVALSDAQLRNETITFLLAGHETTANALTWCFHLIAQHPEVERQLVEEIATVLGQRTPVMEDLGKLVYTRRVIQESMRLYPPIWIIERRAIDADCVEGFQIPKGSSVVISPYALHRHPAYWEDPERFDPSRFEQHPPAAYLPFGAGPRTCIGNEFAMMEALIITAMVMQSFHLQAEPGQRIEPQPDITLRPKHGVMMTYHPREGR
jgi:cytochrome P450